MEGLVGVFANFTPHCQILIFLLHPLEGSFIRRLVLDSILELRLSNVDLHFPGNGLSEEVILHHSSIRRITNIHTFIKRNPPSSTESTAISNTSKFAFQPVSKFDSKMYGYENKTSKKKMANFMYVHIREPKH